MDKLQKAKLCIGKSYNSFKGKIKITKVRQMKDGTILAYNQHNWCCNINILRDDKGKYLEDFLNEKELPTINNKVEDKE